MSENQYQKLVRLTHFVLSTTEHFPTLRGIAVDWEGDTIQMYFYNDGAISAELENDYSCVGTEVVAHYGTSYIHEEMIRWDCPTPLPFHRFCAYREGDSWPAKRTFIDHVENA